MMKATLLASALLGLAACDESAGAPPRAQQWQIDYVDKCAERPRDCLGDMIVYRGDWQMVGGVLGIETAPAVIFTHLRADGEQGYIGQVVPLDGDAEAYRNAVRALYRRPAPH